MIGAGAIMAMIHSLKTNARSKRKAFSKFKVSESVPDTLKEAVKHKEISPDELNLIKRKIRKKATQNNQKKLIVRFIIISILLIPILFFSNRLITDIQSSKEKTAKEYEQKLTEDYKTRQELIIKGHQLLQNGEYMVAKELFNRAAEIDPDDYLLQLGLTACYLRFCIYNNVYCDKAKEHYKNLLKTYGNQPEIERLDTEYQWIMKNKP